MGWSRSFTDSLSGVAIGVGLLMLATPVSAVRAESGANVRLVLDGVIAPRCDFVNVPTDLAMNLPDVRVAISNLGFSCNLPDSAPINIRIASQNGGLKREGASDVVAYSVGWAIAGTADQPLGPDPLTLTVPSGRVGEVRQGAFVLRAIHVPDRLPAGSYSDRITYTISP